MRFAAGTISNIFNRILYRGIPMCPKISWNKFREHAHEVKPLFNRDATLIKGVL